MNNYICNICNEQFKSKNNLLKHLNKKNKCNITTDFQCLKCLKYFTCKKTLNEHTKKNTCKEKTQIIKANNNDNIAYLNDQNNSITEIKSAIKLYLESSSFNTDEKITLIKKYNLKITDEEMKMIINSDLTLDGKVLSLSTYINNDKIISNINNGNITTTTNSNNNNNVTNNILINNFGQENLSYMDNEYFKNLIMNQHIEKGYVQLIKDIYLNKDHPENKTVKVENINNKYANVYNNGKWEAILKADLKEQLHKKNYTILKMHYDKLKKTMTVPKKEETFTFLKRDDFSDPHMMYVIDKIILLFYNDNDGEDILEKSKINKNII
jgi:hypothetical protein